MVVFVAPPWNAKNGDAWPLTPTTFELANGHQVRYPQIAGVTGTVPADEKRWYAVIPRLQPLSASQLPQADLTAFDWADGREVWRMPCVNSASLIAMGTFLFHTRTAGAEPDNVLVATDPATGQERWHRTGGSIRGMFLANDRLYTYNESVDTGVLDTQGQFLNVFDPRTSAPVQRVRFYPEYRPNSTLGALVWLPQERLLVGTFEIHTPGQDVVEIRALDTTGKPIWSHLSQEGFHIVNGIVICTSHGVTALDPATGQPLWQHPGRAEQVLGAWGGTVVVRSGPTLLGFDPHNGVIVWKLPLPILPPDSLPAGAAGKRGSAVHSWPTDIAVHGYGQYLAIAQTRTEGHSAALSVYTFSLH